MTKKTSESTKRKGQTNLHCGYMIGAIGGNQKSWLLDEEGNDLPKGEFHAVRGSMGLLGGTKDILCQEILEPCAAIANKIFQPLLKMFCSVFALC